MRRFLIIFLGVAAVCHAGEPSRPVHLTGAFQNAVGDTGHLTDVIPGYVWASDNPEMGGIGTLKFELSATTDTLTLFVAGFPNSTTQRLSLQTQDGRRELKLGLRSPPGPFWCLYRWNLPMDWREKTVVLVAEDTTPDPWLGIGIPETHATARSANWSALRSSLIGILLTLMPFFTAMILVPTRFWSDPPLRVTMSLVISGIFSLTLFFGFYFSQHLGFTLVTGGMIAALYAAWKFLRTPPLSLERFTPLLATLSLAVLAVAALYLYGGTESPEGVPAGRYDLSLPPDNHIPEFFAEKIYQQEPLQPFLEDWLTSDRPPLQTGFLLFSRPFVANDAGRIAAAIACQLGVYAGLWVLLGALGVPRPAARLCLLACITSGFFLLNTIYTWPKLLPAGFLLAAAGLLFRISEQRRTAHKVEIVLLSACAALAMLGHGGSFFGLVALGIVHLARGGWRDWRLIAGSAAVAFLLYAPWMAYQHWIDPPGDRLLKYHLAGREAIDPRGALAVMADAYHQTPASEIIANKWSNLRVLAGDFTNIFPSLGRSFVELFKGEWALGWWRFSNAMQGGSFFHMLQSLGVLVAGLPFLWLGRRQPLAPKANYCALVAVLSILVWCALMFGPESTVIHQGTYLTGSLLHIAAILGLLLRQNPRLTWAILIPHLGLWLILWIFSPSWDPWHKVLRPTWSPFWLIILVAAALGVVCSGRKLDIGANKKAD